MRIEVLTGRRVEVLTGRGVEDVAVIVLGTNAVWTCR
jgi:hypothetical protein